VQTVSNGGARTDTVNYEYNGLGQLVRTYTGDVDTGHTSTNSDGKALTDVRYAYDELGRLIQVSLVERNDTTITPETTKYYFDAVGNLANQVQSNGVVAQHSYDGLNRLTTLVHFVDADHDFVVDTAETVLAKFAYTLNKDGSRATETDFTDNSTNVAMTFAWTYDGLNRLTTETFTNHGDTTSSYIDTFAFDMAGNRQSLDHDAGTSSYFTTYIYDSNDRLRVEIHDADVDANDTYTATSYGTDSHWTMQTSSVVRNGTTSGGSVLTTTSYTYDNQGRLIQTSDGTTVSTYAYDAAGSRITQTTGTGSTPITVINYTVDTNNPTGYSQTLEERSTTASVTTTKTYTIGLDVIGQYDTNSTAGTMMLVYDGHGSTRDVAAVISTVVTILQNYAYDAYGVRISASNLTSLATAALTSLLYSGEQTDKSGMQFLRARYYRADVGRFLSLDSFEGNVREPLSLHKYLYGWGNPIFNIDPTGMFSLSELISIQGIQNTLRRIYESRPVQFVTRGLRNKRWTAYLVGGWVGGGQALSGIFPLWHLFLYVNNISTDQGVRYDIYEDTPFSRSASSFVSFFSRLSGGIGSPGHLYVQYTSKPQLLLLGYKMVPVARFNNAQFAAFSVAAGVESYFKIASSGAIERIIGPSVLFSYFPFLPLSVNCTTWALSAAATAAVIQILPFG
jgi:RHS repeat-associated protein